MKRNIFLSFTYTAISIFLSFSLFAGDCTVDWGTTHQPIKGFGASNAWTGSTMPDNLETFFFNTTGSNLGISIIRMRIPDSNGGEIPSIKKAQIINPLITVWGSPWTPQNTAWKSTGSLNSGCLISTYYQAYADYLTKYVKDLATNNSINLYACSVQNEPDWDTSGSYEMCTWTAEQMHQFVKNNLGPAMQAGNPTCKILMPESFGCSLALSDPALNDAAAAPYVGIVGEHFYGLGGTEPKNPPAYPLAVSQGKEYWETEYYNNYNGTDAYDATMTEGLNTARQIHNAMTGAEFNAYHYWWFQSGGTNTNSGLLPSGCTDPSCAPKYAYCFGQFSKFIRPGYIRIDTTLAPVSGVYVSAYKNAATGDFAIVAINSNTSITSQRFVLSGGMNPATVTPWLTDATNNLIQQAAASVSAGAFTYNLPASSVVTFYGNSGTVPTTPTNTPTLTPVPCSVMLDDCEDGNTANNWGGSWYNYVSNTSTILPSPFVMTAPGMTGSSNYCASMTGNIAAGAYGGMGCNLNSAGTGVDLTGYTGVEFYAKGTGSYWFQLTQSTITGSYFGYAVNVSSTTNWTKFTVNFPADLTQRYGGPGTLTLNSIIALQWASNANGAMDLQIDNIKFLQPCGGTPTNTPVVTNTFTDTYTRTITATPTMTRTNTFTATPVLTGTDTPTSSSSPTNTLSCTPTLTRTGTPSFTMTVTPSNTPAGTYTFTPTVTLTVTRTHTLTSTVVYTSTFTPTATLTGTMVNSRTSTPTSTLTFSPTPTPTFTATLAGTVTFTPTVTLTVTRTHTLTSTPVFTYTNTPTITPFYSVTVTPSQTAFASTPTFTLTYTETQTQSPSSTATASQTALPVLTYTPTMTLTTTFTSTPVASATRTPIITSTPTLTRTPVNTPSFTATGTAVRTATATITAAAGIAGSVIYPNPFNPAKDDLRFCVDMATAGAVKFRLYSRSFRLIREAEAGNAAIGKNICLIKKEMLTGMASGIYYAVILNEKTGERSKPAIVFLIN
jgi:glucuronoarabinoxylan endo-1,4-beta-xylanase